MRIYWYLLHIDFYIPRKMEKRFICAILPVFMNCSVILKP